MSVNKAAILATKHFILPSDRWICPQTTPQWMEAQLLEPYILAGSPTDLGT